MPEPKPWQPGDRVIVSLPNKQRGTRGGSHEVDVHGTVREVDLPGQPPGVKVDLDHEVNGVRDCYATPRTANSGRRCTMVDPARVYLDPGSRASGRYSPPRRCVVITRHGPVLTASRYPAGTELLTVRWRRGESPRGAPLNVAVRYDDGSEAVIPFPRRLRKADR